VIFSAGLPRAFLATSKLEGIEEIEILAWHDKHGIAKTANSPSQPTRTIFNNGE